MVPVAALSLSWLIDRLWGEPRSAWHPVAWFGRVASPLGERIRRLPAPLAFGAGAIAWCLLVGAVAAAAHALESALNDAPTWLALPLLAITLKPTFAWTMLKDEVLSVEAALAQGLDAGRRRLAWLCSRDVSELDAGGVRETAIETLAENLNDSFVAPLFWFAVAGLPGAWAWRAANTLDAMWGYRGPWEWAGKWTARADDVLAWVPARLAGLLLWQPGTGLSKLRREARLTPSPNGGWPMASMALRLQVRLGKSGVYVLNRDAPGPTAHSLRQSIDAAERASRLALVGVVLVLLAVNASAAVTR